MTFTEYNALVLQLQQIGHNYLDKYNENYKKSWRSMFSPHTHHTVAQYLATLHQPANSAEDFDAIEFLKKLEENVYDRIDSINAGKLIQAVDTCLSTTSSYKATMSAVRKKIDDYKEFLQRHCEQGDYVSWKTRDYRNLISDSIFQLQLQRREQWLKDLNDILKKYQCSPITTTFKTDVELLNAVKKVYEDQKSNTALCEQISQQLFSKDKLDTMLTQKRNALVKQLQAIGNAYKTQYPVATSGIFKHTNQGVASQLSSLENRNCDKILEDQISYYFANVKNGTLKRTVYSCLAEYDSTWVPTHDRITSVLQYSQ